MKNPRVSWGFAKRSSLHSRFYVEQAIQDRLFAPESFKPIQSFKEREHKYYRIPVGNYIILYAVIGNVMEIRRFVYEPSDWRTTI